MIKLIAITVALCMRTCIAGVAPAMTPPRGWRSWNGFLLDITQDIIVNQAKALTKSRGGSSLLECGYTTVGIDDGYQAAGDGVDGSFHDAQGNVLVNTTKFPSMKEMAEEIHGMKAKVGWYANNCWDNAAERKAFPDPSGGVNGGNVEKDVAFLTEVGFDGLKIDGCGPAHNITAWTDAINKQDSHDVVVENCGDNSNHWSPPEPKAVAASCSWNLYRISTDIAPQFYSTMYNLNQQPQYAAAGASRPGCWAYPDMLQVGNLAISTSHLTLTEARTHFAGWCVTSSPLVLGMDMTNSTELSDDIAAILMNKLALSINSDWQGHPGTLVANSTNSFQVHALHGASASRGTDVMLPETQVWAKKLADNRVAVLMVNIHTEPHDITASLQTVGFAGTTAQATDVWTGKTLGAVHGAYTASNVAPHDSVFLVLSP